MATTLRRLMAGRLLGMAFEGFVTWLMLAGYALIYGGAVPMAALLGILTGLLAFLPNIGALMSGPLMVLVGFSGGTDMGLYTIFGLLRGPDLRRLRHRPDDRQARPSTSPRRWCSALQLIMGVLFGILGLFLADPLLAMIKVALERARRAERGDGAEAEPWRVSSCISSPC